MFVKNNDIRVRAT